MAAHPGEEVTLIEEFSKTLERTKDAYLEHADATQPIVTWARRHAHETRGMVEIARITEHGEAKRREVSKLFNEALTELRATIAARENESSMVEGAGAPEEAGSVGLASDSATST